ncbi:MAG: Mrp/NBP35 family ATP-binding protein [Chromatiales bacterium]|nr:Mrp/NBP35 family ATP-binding protein [Chromatiales bacterium]
MQGLRRRRASGALPLDIRIREQADSGTPDGGRRPRRPRSPRSTARSRAGSRCAIAAEGRGLSAKFPSIVIQNT